MTTAKAQLLTVLQHADYQDRRPTLNLAFAIDQNYLKPCGICLNSVALNNPDLAIDFYIFTTFFDNFGFEQIVAQVIQPVKQHVSDFFIRGQQAGVFRSGLDLGFIFATIIGSMMANHALTEETSASWAVKMTDLLWPMIAA